MGGSSSGTVERGPSPLQATLTATQPSLRDQLAWGLAQKAGLLGAGRYAQQDIASKVGGILDFIPGVGETLGADDVASSLDAGNYRNALINGAALAMGVVPVAGDAAGKSLKNYAYHRFTRGPNPDNGVGFMMFAHGSPDRVDNYGDYHWAIDPGDMPSDSIIDADDPAIQQQFADMLRENWDEVESRGYSHASPDGLAMELAPEDIVNSAQLWDSDLIDLAWEKFLEPRGVLGVKTPDGFIAFDPQYVRGLGKRSD